MDIAEMFFTALFCFVMVFTLLAGLYISLKILTSVIKYIERKMSKE